MALSPDLNNVLKALPNLKADELQQVRGKATALLSLSGATVGQVKVFTSVDYLLDGVYFELRRRGLLRKGAGLSDRMVPSTYKEASLEVRKTLEERVGKLSPVELSALGQLSVRALATYLERGNVPISTKTLFNNIAKILLALEASYPGYLEAGLLPACWRKQR